MPKPRILFFNPVRHAVAVYRSLAEIAVTEVVTSQSREGFFSDLKNKYAGINAIYRTSASGAVGCSYPGFYEESCIDLVRLLDVSTKTSSTSYPNR